MKEKSDLKPTVAVDLDGVLAKYDVWKGLDHIGDPIPGAQDFVKALREHYSVLIHTTRTSWGINHKELATLADADDDASSVDRLINRVEAWLDKHGFEVDGIWSAQGKPLAVAYIDDRSIRCEPQVRVAERAYHDTLMKLHYHREIGSHEWGPAQQEAASACQ